MNHGHRYLLVFFFVVCLPVFMVVAVNVNGFLIYRQTPGSNLLNNRLHKLAGSPAIDIVFLGDSSLGAWIDDEQFARLSGLNAKSLSLTGQWGYGGSLAILERVLNQQKSPPLVVLVHTTVCVPGIGVRGSLIEARS